MIKRGLLVIILFLFSLELVSATLDIKLDRSAYSSGESISGAVNYSFSGAKEADSIIKIYLDDILISDEITLKDALETSGTVYDLIQKTYSITNDNVPGKSFSFNSLGSEVKLGIKFSKNNLPDSISSFKLDIKGEAINGNYPMLPYLNFGELNDTNEYNYIGSLKNEYRDLNKEYLATNTPPREGDIMHDTRYCEKVNLNPSSLIPPSTNYSINAFIKKGADFNSKGAGVKLYGFIYEGDISAITSYSCDSTKVNEKKCCELKNPVGSNLEEVSCNDGQILGLNVDENEDHYICIIQTGDDKKYYKIGYEDLAGIVMGYVDDESNKERGRNWDFFIWGKYRVFETNLTNTIIISETSGKIIDALGDFIVTSCVDKDCIIPIKAGSKGPGKVTLSNLLISYTSGLGQTLNNFIEINYIPEKVSSSEIMRYSIDDLGLSVPATVGGHKLKIEINGESKEADFSVVPNPIASIYYEPWAITTGIPVYFTADESSSPSGAALVKFGWDFGDNSYSNSSNATHAYKTAGTRTVKLNITDANGFIGEDSKEIEVLSLNESVRDNLNLSKEFINLVKSQVASSEEYVKDTAELLGLNSIWDNTLLQIDILENKYKTANNYTNITKETELMKVYNDLMSLMDRVPGEINVQSFKFPASAVSISEIPSASELKISGAKDDFAEAVLAYQEGVNIDGDARIVKVVYLSGKEETFTLVKKIITSAKSLNGKIYEIIPNGNIRNITTPGYLVVDLNKIYNWPANTQTIVYTLNESDASYGINTRTIIIPQLSDLKFDSGGEELFETGYDCGNNICDFGEDEISCPEDCKRKYPWTLIVSLILMALIGVYYFNFYTGPYNYKEIGNLFKKKPKLFKSKDEENKLVNFAKVSRERGLNDNQIKFMLKSKGWNEAQINEALKKTEPKQKKVIKIGK